MNNYNINVYIVQHSADTLLQLFMKTNLLHAYCKDFFELAEKEKRAIYREQT